MTATIQQNDTESLKTKRLTYNGWQAVCRQVKKGQRRGSDGMFGFEQTKAAGGGYGPRTCATCGCRINYGRFCGKCEFGR